MAHNSWTFSPAPGSTAPRTVQLTPRLVHNSTRAAVASAISGHGVARLFSYQVAEQVHQGELEVVLPGEEDTPLPVHVISPQGRLSVPRVRAFTDFATPRFRKDFARLAKGLSTR
jgi:DNA-binding transcriptional LysR family regulator